MTWTFFYHFLLLFSLHRGRALIFTRSIATTTRTQWQSWRHWVKATNTNNSLRYEIIFFLLTNRALFFWCSLSFLLYIIKPHRPLLVKSLRSHFFNFSLSNCALFFHLCCIIFLLNHTFWSTSRLVVSYRKWLRYRLMGSYWLQFKRSANILCS